MGGMASPFCEILSIESAACFEPGDYVKDYAYMSDTPEAGSEAWNSLYGKLMGGVPGALMYFDTSANVNNYGITADRMHYTAAESKCANSASTRTTTNLSPPRPKPKRWRNSSGQSG